MAIEVKICGLSSADAVAAAVENGARHLGFVFYPPSPRAVEPDLGDALVRQVPTGPRSVGLFVDPTDEELDSVLDRVPLDMIQLHGAETPQRVAAIRARWSLPVMKALKVAAVGELAVVPDYAAVSDRLLFDAVEGRHRAAGRQRPGLRLVDPVRPKLVQALDAGRRSDRGKRR